MASTTFSLRVSPRDYELLTRLAEVHGTTLAELSRQLIHQGIRRMLDPDEIERALNAERERLLKAAEDLQAVDWAASSATRFRTPD